ncbi:MAG: hypothetical protein AAGG46_09450, partial [Planctomycetota bacterium]
MLRVAFLFGLLAAPSLAAPVAFMSDGFAAPQAPAAAVNPETDPSYHGALPSRFTLFPPPPVGEPAKRFSAKP